VGRWTRSWRSRVTKIRPSRSAPYRPGTLRRRRSLRRDFCTGPTPAKETAVRANFGETVRAWGARRFPPLRTDGRGGALRALRVFPDVHGTGARQIRGFLVSEDGVTCEARRARSAERRGARACRRGIASLFFGRESLLQPAPPVPFRCKLAVAVAKTCRRLPTRRSRIGRGDKMDVAHREPGGRTTLSTARMPGDDGRPEGDPDRHRAVRTSASSRRSANRLTTASEPRALQSLARGADYIAAFGRRVAAFLDVSGVLGLLPDTPVRVTAAPPNFEFANLNARWKARALSYPRRLPIRSFAPSQLTARSCCKSLAILFRAPCPRRGLASPPVSTRSTATR